MLHNKKWVFNDKNIDANVGETKLEEVPTSTEWEENIKKEEDQK